MEEESARELRSSRSRSNTPFIRASRDKDGTHGTEEFRHVIPATQTKRRLRGTSGQKSGVSTVKESHTSEVSVTTSAHVLRKTGNDSDSSTEHAVEDKQKIGKGSDLQRAKRRLLINGATPRKGDEALAMAAEAGEEEKLQKKNVSKTSDCSSKEGDGIAYQIYKKAGDWWNKFPKTDYTYSRGSPHRKELVPGVIPMPNMSRRSLNTVRQHSSSENRISSSAVTTKHYVTKSRFFDHSTSGSQASRQVLEDWAAVDSDVDDVAESLSKKTPPSISKQWTISTVVTSFFITIWTFITVTYSHTVGTMYRLVSHYRGADIYATPRRGMTAVWVEGSSSWLQRLFTWVHHLVSSVIWLDTLLLSCWRTTQIEQEHETYSDDYYTEKDDITKSLPSQRSNKWRLLLLLLPLLFLAGWWGVSEATEFGFNLLVETTDVVRNTLVGWMFIPFGAYSALKEKLFLNTESHELPPIVLPHSGVDPQQHHPVDMEALAQYILSSAQFQQVLTTHIHSETRDAQKALFESTNIQQEHHMHMKLSQLTYHLQQLQQNMDRLSSQADETQARERERELKLEELKQTLRREAAATQPLITDGDQVLMRKELRDIQSRLRLLQERQVQMSRRCCQHTVAVDGHVVEQHVFRVLADLLGATGGQFSGNPEDLRAWVSSVFLAHNDLETRLANLTLRVQLQMREAVLQSKELIMASVSKHIQNEFSKWQEQQGKRDIITTVNSRKETWTSNSSSVVGLTDLQVRAIVDEALAKYDADKTGLVDYALESSGGSVISTRCTETYQAKTPQLSVMGIPLWYPPNNPRTVIQPGVHPGECWAFSGSQGFLVIKLSGLVKISAFSLEHIPRSLSPYGRIDSAPKDFTVWGLKDVQDTEPVLLGKYTYQQNGTSLQHFSVQNLDVDLFELVELRIESNHGHMEYTCLYRFRVHGVLISD